MQEAPGIGIATVYRSLKALSGDGRIVMVEIPGQMPRYERSNKAHHHHFVCRKCEGVFELEKCLEGIKTLAPKKFRVDSHEIILYGLCDQCVQKAGPRRQPFAL